MYYKQQYNYIAYIASTVSTFMKVMTPPAPPAHLAPPGTQVFHQKYGNHIHVTSHLFL